jgi:glycosyltransferase involved in cell wall biosynthesis
MIKKDKKRILIITSSYPKSPGDPSGTAGLFVSDFADSLTKLGYFVVVQPIGRSATYSNKGNKKIIIKPIPWNGGSDELASISLINPISIYRIIKLFFIGYFVIREAAKEYKINYILGMWFIPSGIFAYFIKKNLKINYDLWALGSDIWRVKKIPLIGKYLIKKVASEANNLMADGISLSNEVAKITKKICIFTPSSRFSNNKHLKIIEKRNKLTRLNLIYIGRYHKNKGPDLLIEAIKLLDETMRKKINLEMYGLGNLESKIRSMANTYNLLEFIQINGPIDKVKMKNRFNECDFLVIPSRIESIPLIFSDAMHCNIPVIANPAGDLGVIINKYSCGIVSNNVSPRSLAAAIIEAYQEGPNKFRNGVKLASEKFNILSTTKHWVESI